MKLDIQKTQDLLCKRLCADIRVFERKNGLFMLETPFTFPDGDRYALYLEPLNAGGVRITDGGHTVMHLSYENEIASFREGTRGRLFEQVLGESEVEESEGELWIDSSHDDLPLSVFRLGQVITRLYDLTFLNRTRVASTFYEDLHQALTKIVPIERIQKDYAVPNVTQSENYQVDFYIEGGDLPLYCFGITAGRDKARFATIILQHLELANVLFESLLVFEDQTAVPGGDLARLSNAGGEQVASLDAQDDLARKVLKRVGAN